MSNAAVGPVYDSIITEVINSVRVDFEENGVDEGVLEDLKKRWQAKLSQMKVAQFPWDPKPEPPPASAAGTGTQAATVPQTSAPATNNYTHSTLSPQGPAQSLSLPGQLAPNAGGMALKQEPGLVNADPVIKQEPGLPSMPSMHPGYNPAATARGTAAQRAAQALENQFGQRAAASINAIHSGMASQMNAGAQPQQSTRPGQAPQPMNAQQQYRQDVAAAMQQRLQQVPHTGAPNGLPASQVDGPSDAACGSGPRPTMGRTEIDEHLHAQLAARAKQMEGGGLMLPLKDATKDRSVPTTRPSKGGLAQHDGAEDGIKSEEDEDKDAINSDLDDSDEDKDDEEDDDESMGHMMLCMYDKVQRVKNKWKCILKDGVLTVNGKEYVFHKATGEYEW
ncbi:0cb395f9-9580-4b99-a663-8f50a5716b7b [Thermothielavioides terrestris]|uniref:Transcription initiation factor IIA large subunit n=2 Tax=Thermothielavioides terrestris TaxID=2587410 RepID=G2REY1_THETT|nr:uncharacterized protein THITE_2121465 [Thermothielavioides terrestris NRRL 8126]AEO70264.1 hypothetical protein THITE_2121465 [Thermothielavioides terrestris NRRL 8126]SPQ18069.1 0cb395f9-9580-4b99-a663-8f50a5716b7b [Thermothielavioides terrestris]